MLKKLSTIYSTTDKRFLMSHLKDKGKKKPKNWTLIHSEPCGENELNFDVKPLLTQLSKKHGFSKEYFAIDIVSNPDAESRLDFGQFRVRYRYVIAKDHVGESLIKDNTREFCSSLVRANKIYRREDINIMSFRGANPIAKTNYSIFKLKGHWNCRHAWAREVYVVERDPAETENNPIVEKVTLSLSIMSKIEKAVAAFKAEMGDQEITKDVIVEINKELLSEQTFKDVKIDDKILRIDGEIAEGTPVSWIDGEEVSEVPNGEITLPEEKKVLTITDGKISGIVDVEEEAEEEEDAPANAEMSEEKVVKIVKETLSEVIKEELKTVKESFSEIVDEKLKDVPAFASSKKKASFKAADEEEETPAKEPRRNKINAPFSVPGKK